MPLAGQNIGLRGVSPTSASPTAGVNPRTLDQILSMFMQTMNRSPQNQRQLPPMTLSRKTPQPSAFQRMQQYQGTR